jgi:chromosome segregation ATPase
MASLITNTPTPSLTDRLLTSLLHEQKELQGENEKISASLESLVKSQSESIKTLADENALLKAELAALKHEADTSRRAVQAQSSFIREQQALIGELREKNSNLSESEQVLKELLALVTALEDEMPKALLRCADELRACGFSEHHIPSIMADIKNGRTTSSPLDGGHFKPVVKKLRELLAAQAKDKG